MKTVQLVVGCVASLLLAGCASTRQFVPLPDQAKKVEDLTKGRIYVIRPATFGAAISMNVSEDGKPIGVTGPHGFLCWERTPGDTIITSTSEGASEVPLTVEPGNVYYLFQHVRMGLWIARSELERVDEDEGLKELKKCKPPKLESPPPSPVAVQPAVSAK